MEIKLDRNEDGLEGAVFFLLEGIEKEKQK